MIIMDFTKNKRYKDSDIIKASEIGQYCFCSISWFLQKCGYKPISPMIEIGIKKHKELGKIIELSQKSSKKSKALAVAGYLILLFGLFIILSEVVL